MGGNRNEGRRGGGLSRFSGLSVAAFLGVSAPLALVATATAAGEWRVTPSLELAETYTDNVDLTATNRKADFVTRISPGVHVTGAGARLNLNVDYTANFLIFARAEKETDLRHNLNASLNSELVEDWLYIDSRASINQQFLERGGALSGNEANVTDNRQTVQIYSVAPTLQRALGSVATVTARYELSYIQVGKPDQTAVLPISAFMSNTLTHHGLFAVDSGRQFTRLRWGLNANYYHDDRTDTNRSTDRTIIRAYGDYALNEWLRLVGSMGYEKISDNTLTRRPNGFIWDAGVTLTPGPRTELTMRGGSRYGQDNWTVYGTYRITDRLLFSLGYTEEITTSQRILQEQLAFDRDNPSLDPGGFSLSDVAFRRKRVYGTISGTRGRTQLSSTAFYEERQPELVGEVDENNYGVTASASRRLSRHLTAHLSGTYQHTKFSDHLNRTDNYYSAQAGANYALSAYLSTGVTYFFTQRNSTDALRAIRENAVRLTIRGTF